MLKKEIRSTNGPGGQRLKEDVANSIKDYIKPFPAMESRYSREESKRKFLNSNVSLTKIYELYILRNKHLENPLKSGSYTKIFMENFNLGFHKPKKDRCSTCLTYKNMNSDENKNTGYQKHLLNKTIT